MRAKEIFRDWVDPDYAEYYLACLLGLMVYEEDLRGEFSKVKGVFNTRNKVGDALFEMLERMVEGGFLEKNDDWQYRWNPSFRGYWEEGTDGGN